MINKAEPPKSISVSEFKAHCTEELRSVEEKGTRLVITRHGKTIALVEPPRDEPLRPLGELMGSAEGLIAIRGDADLDESAWSDDDWTMHCEGEGS